MRGRTHDIHEHLHERRHRRGPLGHGPGHGGPRGRRHGGRAQRGDVRAAVLLLLVDEPMHGYQLMQAINDRTGGAWRPSPGAIYPTINQLEDEGLVRVDAAGGRKLVSLTDAGRAYLDEQGEKIGDPFAGMAGPGGGHGLRHAMEELRTAVRAVAQSGSNGQVAAALQILTDARRSLYLLLADGDKPETATDPT